MPRLWQRFRPHFERWMSLQTSPSLELEYAEALPGQQAQAATPRRAASPSSRRRTLVDPCASGATTAGDPCCSLHDALFRAEHCDAHHAITTGGHTSVSAGKSLLVSVKEAMRLFAPTASLAPRGWPTGKRR